MKFIFLDRQLIEKSSTNNETARFGFKHETMLIILIADKVTESTLPEGKPIYLSELVYPMRIEYEHFLKKLLK